MNGVIYARYSAGPNQTDASIEGQVRDCKRFAEQNNINILNIYADKHISGRSTKGRDQLAQMLEDAQKGLFDCIITWKTDRIGRDKYELAIIKKQLKTAGVKIYYSAEVNIEGAEAVIIESLMEGLAEYYSLDLAQKVKRGRRNAAEKGKWTSSVPIGYKKVDGVPVPDEQTAPYIVDIYNMYIAGIQEKDILQYLEDNGIRTKKGKAVAKSTLFRILRNTRYLGNWVYEDIIIPVEPIIDEITFRKAQEINMDPSRTKSRSTQEKYMLSGKVYCADCGALMNCEYGTSRNGDKHYYLHCKPCKKRYNMTEIQEQILRHTMEDVLQDDIIEQMVDEIMELQEQDESEQQIAALERNKDSIQKKINNLLNLIEDNPSNALLTRLNALETDFNSINDKITELKLNKPKLSRELVSAYLHQFQKCEFGKADYFKMLIKTFIYEVRLSESSFEVLYSYGGKSGSNSVPSVDKAELYSNRKKMPRIQVFDGYIRLIIA